MITYPTKKLEIAIVWGHQHDEIPWQGCRGTTHHQFWEATLRSATNINTHRYNWENWQKMPVGLDCYLFVDFHPTLFRVCRTNYHPRVFYWYDHFHHSFVYPAQIIDCFDRSYFAEKQPVIALNNLGVSKVKWLPPAYYPGIHHPIGTIKLHNYAFVGQPDDCVIRKGLTRKEFFEKLSIEPNLHGYIGQGIYGNGINKVYNESEILLDRTIYNNIGTRFFETIGSGGFLLANRGSIPNGMDELAMDGQHFISYDDSYNDCLEKMRFYLQHHEERKRIATNGEAYFKKHHTYIHRLMAILSDLGYTISGCHDSATIIQSGNS